jgi:hypothetical protein
LVESLPKFFFFFVSKINRNLNGNVTTIVSASPFDWLRHRHCGWLAARAADGPVQVLRRHNRVACTWLADAAERLLDTPGAALVRANGNSDAFRRHHAHTRTMGSKGLHTWFNVILPASLPFIVSGMKQGWAFAWRSLMAAEIYVTILTGFGLGHLLHYGRELNAMDQVIGVMLVIVVIGLLADKIVFAPWERFLHRRWGTGRA